MPPPPPPPSQQGKYRFSIDRGGTFTDVFAECPSGTTRVCKLLSKHELYEDAPTEAIRRIIQIDSGRRLTPTEKIDSTVIESIRMGTTVATNALLERKGERTGLVITKGFKDLLHIGNQARPSIFDLSITSPPPVYSAVVEVQERVILTPNDNLPCQLPLEGLRRVRTPTSDITVLEELDEAAVIADLEKIRDQGIKSLAIVLLHSWVFDEHESRVRDLAYKIGFEHVSTSHEVMRMVRVVPRGFTTTVDAYTTPLIKEYLQSFKSGFTDLEPWQVLFMQSDGGLTTMNRFCGSRAVLSGPAGGVVGYARTVFEKYKMPVIGFDMGGTSTDVSRFDGELSHTFESVTAGVPLQCPQLDIHTVAAGGGSILTFHSGIYNVGPESAGARPGPVAYDQGGTDLTITDANLMLSRLVPAKFPKIFGPSHDAELNVAKTTEKFKELQKKINEFNREHGMAEISVQDVALGFIRVANETMARPIRNITQGKGFDPSNHMLACFGGAGGQHACAIAASLGVKLVSVPRYAGILSAVGIFLADVVVEGNEPVGKTVTAEAFTSIDAHVASRFSAMCSDLGAKLASEGTYSEIQFETYLNMRYHGTDCGLMIREAQSEGLQKFCDKFRVDYARQFGFQLDRELVVDDIRVRAVGCNAMKPGGSGKERRTATVANGNSNENTQLHVDAHFDCGTVKTAVMECVEGSYPGPCLILDELSTIVVEPGWVATVASEDVKLEHVDIGPAGGGGGRHTSDNAELDSIVLSIFSHRFMSIAEQMGRILQRTSVSTNIKERLDFSCAIFGPDGGLVSNAPHIPVHLGAMQEAVQYQLKVGRECRCYEGCCGGGHGAKGGADDGGCSKLYPGDVILTNHPIAGGSHLPDLTVITPVFQPSDPKNPIFFVANRGHHADIGGITPGSMPPNSKSIDEEGAVFKTFKIVNRGAFMEKELVRELMRPGEYPGSSGTRNLSDNLSDLKAQIAANQKGIVLLNSLIGEYTLAYVQTYMKFIQENAEVAVRDMLRSVADKHKSDTLEASDFMDDGTEIRLRVTIDKHEGDAVFDFSGTTFQVIGNCNAPRAITLSAVIYCLRCLVGRDIPLNQGCLRPVRMKIPEGSILHPSEEAAVVGGNVQTCQRVVDVILRAFRACAASQGCMNNITFGTEKVGYYETVAGGAGAGPTWDGRSGVHTHMTNTRITDPEILEIRYPVLLNHFSLEVGSGGVGLHPGGDGVRREILFRSPMTLSILSERRVFRPYGLEGGGDARRGRNLLATRYFANRKRLQKRKLGYDPHEENNGPSDYGDMKLISLGGKTSVNVDPGDMFVLLSPGGGGWGVGGKARINK